MENESMAARIGLPWEGLMGGWDNVWGGFQIVI